MADANEIKKFTIWNKNQEIIVVTNFNEHTVEYRSFFDESAYYISKTRFLQIFKPIQKNFELSDNQKEFIFRNLEKYLKILKTRNLGDYVYLAMEELGI